MDKQDQSEVLLANSSKTTIMGAGTIVEQVVLPNGYMWDIEINGVLYVPKMKEKLLSVPQITKSGHF